MYKILGSDQKEYGPVSTDQLRQWIAEGRANAQTMVLAEGGMEWKALGALPEFSLALAGGRSPVTQPAAGIQPRTNGLALTSMIIGIFAVIFGFCCCYIGIPFSILGIIFSLIALSQIRANPEAYTGKGLAIAGLVLCLLSFILVAALLAFGLAMGGMDSLLRDLNKL